MPIFAFTQVKGGVGTTSLAANVTNLWPENGRIMVELGITGGSILRTMGYDPALCASRPANPILDGLDLGHEGQVPPSLQEVPQDSWELPMLAAPAIPDFPHPGEPMWWQERVDLMIGTNLDVIADLGTVAPEHLAIHNRVLNASAAVIAVARNQAEALAAVGRLAQYRDRLAVVMMSELYSLPDEVGGAIGCPCAGVLPWDPAIPASMWRGMLATSTRVKPARRYFEAARNLATYLRGE